MIGCLCYLLLPCLLGKAVSRPCGKPTKQYTEMGNLEPPRDMDLEVQHNQKNVYVLRMLTNILGKL